MDSRALKLALGLALTGLAACSAVQPSPDPALSASSMRFGQTADAGPADISAWWARLGDDTLNQLLRQAAVDNIDVRVALQRVRQARAGEAARASALWPTIGLSGSASDSRTTFPDTVKQGSPDTRAARGALETGWELDLFGGRRAASRAAGEDAMAAAMGVDGARLMVVGEVARQYVIWQSARERLRLLESLTATQAQLRGLAERRHAQGLEGRLGLTIASADLAHVQAQAPALRTLMAVTQSRLAVLLARQADSLNTTLASSPRPAWLDDQARAAVFGPPPPVGLPVDLLARRPDVQAARHQWLAETHRLQSAKADLLPKLFLNALLGRQDVSLNGLDLAPVRYSQAALVFSMPLFNAGRIRAAIEAQAATETQAVLNYQRTVIQAVEDVDNSLVAWRSEQARTAALDEAVAARRAALGHARSLHREGQVGLQEPLDAQRALVASELERLDSRAQQALNLIGLHNALGGGWTAAQASTSTTASVSP